MGKTRRLVLGASVAAAVLATTAPHAAAQQLTRCDQGGAATFSRTTRAPQYAIGPKEIYELVSERDGVAIDVAIFRPRVPEGTQVPVVLNATPYHHAQNKLDVRKCKAEFVENFVPQGYAVAFVAVRGTGNSGGCMDLFGPAEQADLNQTVNWLAARPWSTGAVGMIGKSYEGGTPWEVAAMGNPHLKTVVSMAGVPDVFDLLFANGTPDLRADLLADLYFLPSIVTYANGRDPARTIEATACPEYLTANAASVDSTVTGKEDPWGYWAPRRHTRDVLERYRGSVFLTQGFLDLNVPPGQQFDFVRALRERGTPLKMWWGQWGHVNPDQASGDAKRTDWPDAVLDWLDRWLKDLPVDTGSAVDVQDSSGAWRSEAIWPPPGTQQSLWLGADGSLASAPARATATRTLLPDPLHVELGPLVSRPSLPRALEDGCPLPTCTAFATAPQAAPLRFAGRPELELTVVPIVPFGHVTAYLYADDGTTATRIGWGQADVRFPRADEVRRPVTRGTPVKLLLRLQPLDDVVEAGSRLVLVLGQGTAYDRIPSVPTAPMRLRVGGDASLLRLETFSR
jgi:X-Pro dipeptidyl-peptidase